MYLVVKHEEPHASNLLLIQVVLELDLLESYRQGRGT